MTVRELLRLLEDIPVDYDVAVTHPSGCWEAGVTGIEVAQYGQQVTIVADEDAP